MDRIQKFTDLTYGVLLLLGLIVVYVFGAIDLAVGFGVGLFVGYAVHVGSEMVEWTRMQESVENVEDAVEETKDRIESVEEETKAVSEAVTDE